MPSTRFVGRVLPRSFDLSYAGEPTISCTIDSTGFSVDFITKIDHGSVEVTCRYEAPATKEQLNEIYIRAFDIARATVDLVSFSTGYGLVVVLENAIDEMGGSSELLADHSAMAPFCTAYSVDPSRVSDFLDVYRIVLSEPAIFMALNDLIVGISYPHYAPVNCGRAVEGIRHLLAPGIEPKKQWIIMNEKLQIEKSYTKLIMDNSVKPRHGDRVAVSGTMLREIIKRAWIIMSRFLEHKKRGGITLPQAEFPTLS